MVLVSISINIERAGAGAAGTRGWRATHDTARPRGGLGASRTRARPPAARCPIAGRHTPFAHTHTSLSLSRTGARARACQLPAAAAASWPRCRRRRRARSSRCTASLRVRAKWSSSSRWWRTTRACTRWSERCPYGSNYDGGSVRARSAAPDNHHRYYRYRYRRRRRRRKQRCRLRRTPPPRRRRRRPLRSSTTASCRR